MRDSPELPKREERIGQPLSPYAVTKLVNELYAAVYAPPTVSRRPAFATSTFSARGRTRTAPMQRSFPNGSVR